MGGTWQDTVPRMMLTNAWAWNMPSRVVLQYIIMIVRRALRPHHRHVHPRHNRNDIGDSLRVRFRCQFKNFSFKFEILQSTARELRELSQVELL